MSIGHLIHAQENMTTWTSLLWISNEDEIANVFELQNDLKLIDIIVTENWLSIVYRL